MICDPNHPTVVAMLERKQADEAVRRRLLEARDREAADFDAIRAAASRSDHLICRAAGGLSLGVHR